MSEFVEGATTPTETPSTEPPKTPEATNVVDEWVGEGKKYKDVSELAKAYSHADQRLEELKLENERLASENEKAKGVDDVLAAISAQATIAEPTPTPTVTPTEVKGLSPEEVQQLIDSKLDAVNKAAKVKETWAVMDEAFGSHEAASTAVKAYIGEDASKKAIVNNLAISDPIGLMKLLGKDVTKKPINFTTDHASSKTTEGVDLNQQLTWDVANKIRKEDPKLYYSPNFRKRMRDELN